MLASIVTAISADTSYYLPFFTNSLRVEVGAEIIATCTCVIISTVFLSVLLTYFESTKILLDKSSYFFVFRAIQEAVFGLSFGMAMSVTNMSKPSAVIAFLDLRYWNPTLAFVMAGALSVSFPAFRLIFRRDAPILDTKFSLSKLTAIDKKLVLGAMIFGIGWGIAGACPGPAFVNLGSGNIPPVIYCACLMLGMVAEHYTSHVTIDVVIKKVFRLPQAEAIASKVDEKENVQTAHVEIKSQE
jgi:uncharacterized membrane protein YedE/YeeE